MSNTRPVLHFIAGKVGAGKTTLARKLALDVPAVLICEDQWIASLGGEVKTLRDYVLASTRCRKLMVPHLRDVLRVGASVVLDFAGNTPRDRSWVRGIFESAGADHVLHVLDVSETLCIERLRQRNTERPEGLFWGEVSEALFHEVTKYYVPPHGGRGLPLRTARRHDGRGLVLPGHSPWGAALLPRFTPYGVSPKRSSRIRSQILTVVVLFREESSKAS